MCLAIITLAALAVAPVTSVSHNDVVHVGCFKTNLVDTQRSYYMVNEPLSWENGISACIHRYTTHVGVQAVKWLPSKSYFFCGNDLLEHSDKLENSACARCDSTDYHCGGPQSISIYKIRDSTPLVILIAEIERIILLEEYGFHTNNPGLIRTADQDIRHIINFYSRDEVFSLDLHSNKIYKSIFDHRIKEYSILSTVGANSNVRGLAVDWLHEKLYYCDEDWIVEYDMKSGSTRNLYTINSELCYDLAIDPYTRTLFIVFEKSTLSTFSLLTQSYRTYTGGKYVLHDPREVAVDCESQLIYVITQLTADLNTTSLVHLDYNLDNLTILRNDTELSSTWGLDVFNGTVFWARYSECTRNYSIYSCKPSPTCNHENIKHLYNIENVYDIVVYHPERQTPTERHLCSTARCTHGCYRRTLFTAQCTCPEGLILSTDNATCQESINIRETTAAPVTESTETDHDKKMQFNETEETKYLSLPDLQRLVLLKQLEYYQKAGQSLNRTHC